MNTITIELGENTQKLLADILKELRIVSDTTELIRLAVAEGKTFPPVAPVEAQDEPQPAVEEEPVQEPEPATEPQQAPEAPQVQPADIQKKVVELSTAGHRDAVKAIVTQYAKKVSGIPEEKRAEVWQKLTALGG